MAVAEGYEETVLFVNTVALKATPDVTSLAFLDMPKGRGIKGAKSSSRRRGGPVRIKHPMAEEYNDPSAALPSGEQSIGQQRAGQHDKAPAGQHGEQPVGHQAQQTATGQQSAGQQLVAQHPQKAAVNNQPVDKRPLKLLVKSLSFIRSLCANLSSLLQ